MGCGSCGTAANGKPAGCKSNGGCSSGGCNKMNVFDWLADLPLPDGDKPYNVVEVSFNQGSRKEFFRNAAYLHLNKGQFLAVEGTNGFDVGQVSLQGELVKLQMKKYNVQDQPSMKKVLRIATDEDVEQMYAQKDREQDVLVRSRAMARVMNIEMKIAQVEMQADGKKSIFYYTAEQRVDFREIIKQYATEFRTRVEMRQIGARQESAKVGGIGSCGRELCCATWLTDFKTVNTAAARYQNLSINQTKLSGQCGRLKCCLNYELDTYMDALKGFPTDCDHLETAQGRATLQKRDIFRNLMWYSFQGSNKQYPMAIERVKEVRELNKDGQKPEELQALEMEAVIKPKAGVKVDMGFVNDVGQVSLRALERGHKKRSRNEKNKNAAGRDNRQQETQNKKQPQQQKQAQPSNRPQQNNRPKPKLQQEDNAAQKPEEGEGQQQRKSRNNRRRGPRPDGQSGDAGSPAS